MKCIQVQDLLPAYLEDSLPAGKKEEMDSHIRQCGECSEFLREFSKTAGLLETGRDIELPAGYLGRLNARIDGALASSRPNRPWIMQPSLMLPVFAALLMAAGINLYMTEQKPRNTAAKPPAEQFAPVNESIPLKTAQRPAAGLRKTITIAKLPSEYSEDFVLRGPGAQPAKKNILMQWKDLSAKSLETGCVVIRSAGDWDDLWIKLGMNKPSAEIDFSRNSAIVSFGATITGVKETVNKYYLEITETVPGKTGNNADGQPYHIVVVENNN